MHYIPSSIRLYRKILPVVRLCWLAPITALLGDESVPGVYGGLRRTTARSAHTHSRRRYVARQKPHSLSWLMVKSRTLQHLSGWFCFVQTSDGHVVSVFHSQTEDTDIVNMMKGITAVFQANFKGTAEEVEIDSVQMYLTLQVWRGRAQGWLTAFYFLFRCGRRQEKNASQCQK